MHWPFHSCNHAWLMVQDDWACTGECKWQGHKERQEGEKTGKSLHECPFNCTWAFLCSALFNRSTFKFFHPSPWLKVILINKVFSGRRLKFPLWNFSPQPQSGHRGLEERRALSEIICLPLNQDWDLCTASTIASTATGFNPLKWSFSHGSLH